MSLFGTSKRIDKTAAKLGDFSGEMADIGRTQLAATRASTARYAPRFDEALDLQSEAARDARLISAKEGARADEMWGRGDEQWGRYKSTFAPVEDRFAKDAMEFDSPEALERAAQEASAGVSKGFGMARDTRRRDLQRMGVNPSSGAYMGAADELGIAEAAARGHAENTARNDRRTQAFGLRAGAIDVGRSLPMPSGAASSQLALSGDQLALGGAGSMAETAGAAVMAPGAAVNQALPWYKGSEDTLSSAGQIQANKFGSQLGVLSSKYLKEDKKPLEDDDEDGDLLKTTKSGGIFKGLMTMAASSKSVKKDKQSVDSDELVLEGLEKIPVESWKYKKGVADGGRHIGPYAEDVHAQFGDAAAPGGEGLDLITMNGIALKGIQALAKKVARLEQEGGGSRARRDTEPRRHA